MEKINNYTPGKWRVDEDGEYVFPPRYIDEYGEHPICQMKGWGRLQKFENGEELQRANAQLIALAPTLYEQHFKMLDLLRRLSMNELLHVNMSARLIDELKQTIKDCEL